MYKKYKDFLFVQKLVNIAMIFYKYIYSLELPYLNNEHFFCL